MTTTQTKGEKSIVELIFLQKDTEKMNLPAVGCNVGRLWRARMANCNYHL